MRLMQIKSHYSLLKKFDLIKILTDKNKSILKCKRLAIKGLEPLRAQNSLVP